jgi:hypothetical protein
VEIQEMKFTIEKKRLTKKENKGMLLTAMFFLCLSNFVQANDSDLSITPVIHQFPAVILGTVSNAHTFTVKNTHATNDLGLGAITIAGTHSNQYILGSESCEGETLSPGQECYIEVRFQPNWLGSSMATLQIVTDSANTPNLTAFLSNDEGKVKQAQRRLPPVLYSLNIPENMVKTSNYNLEWSILGYHDSYESVIALFDCTGKALGTCGANFSENFATSGLINATNTTPQPTWTYQGIAAVEHHYTFTFNANTEGFPQSAPGNHPIVVRFYSKNNMDAMSGEASLSLLIPGSLTNVYYDNEGRRISKIISVP